VRSDLCKKAATAVATLRLYPQATAKAATVWLHTAVLAPVAATVKNRASLKSRYIFQLFIIVVACAMALRTYGRPPQSVQAVAGDEQATVWWEAPAVRKVYILPSACRVLLHAAHVAQLMLSHHYRQPTQW
jgi:hypothetical protein